MSVLEKYARLLEYAQASGVQKLSAKEQGGVLYITGATDAATKNELWNLYNSIDPDMRSGDLVLNIEETGSLGGTVHEVLKNENLSVIAKKYPGMTWQKIFEANKDILKSPDKIFPGQKLRIPL